MKREGWMEGRSGMKVGGRVGGGGSAGAFNFKRDLVCMFSGILVIRKGVDGTEGDVLVARFLVFLFKRDYFEFFFHRVVVKKNLKKKKTIDNDNDNFAAVFKFINLKSKIIFLDVKKNKICIIFFNKM